MPLLLVGAFLYAYRASVPAVPTPLYNQIYFAQAVVVGLVLLCAAVCSDDDEAEEFAFVVLPGLIFFTTLNAAIPPNLPMFIILLIVWSVPFGALVTMADRDDSLCLKICCRCVMAPCVAGYITIMILIYIYADEEPAFPATDDQHMGGYMVTGATSALLNGLYVLRNDLTQDRVSDDRSWQGVNFFERALPVTLDTPLDPWQSPSVSENTGMRDGVAGSFVLHQPSTTTLWVISTTVGSLLDCGVSAMSYLHSPQMDCYATPDGEIVARLKLWSFIPPSDKLNILSFVWQYRRRFFTHVL